MTPEEVAARTRLEQQAGRKAVRDTEAKAKDSRGIEGRDTSPLLEFVEPSTAQEWAQLPIDPDVKLPADVRASIARGEAKFQEYQRGYKKRRRQRITHINRKATTRSIFIMSVVDQEVQDRRDDAISVLEKQSEGKRGQPPMVVRLRVVCIIVDRLLAEGERFATARESRMNKRVRKRLNELVRLRDRSKSRPKQIGSDAVEYVLKQIKGLLD
jgi:hypothetical protein